MVAVRVAVDDNTYDCVRLAEDDNTYGYLRVAKNDDTHGCVIVVRDDDTYGCVRDNFLINIHFDSCVDVTWIHKKSFLETYSQQ